MDVVVAGMRIEIPAPGHHRVVGRESDGTTRTQAEEFIERFRQDAKNNRLVLPKGRRVALGFSEAAQRYLNELARTNGKDLDQKKRVSAEVKEVVLNCEPGARQNVPPHAGDHLLQR